MKKLIESIKQFFTPIPDCPFTDVDHYLNGMANCQNYGTKCKDCHVSNEYFKKENSCKQTVNTKVVKIDDCEYVIAEGNSGSVSIVHKANCSNH